MPPPEDKGNLDRPTTDFAPKDVTDGRKPFDWQTKWATRAWTQIYIEAGWLLLLMVGGAIAIWLSARATESGALTMEQHLFNAASTGLMGGTIFAIKWFYHLVAKGMWHRDRVWWRVFTPPLSAVVSVVVSCVALRSEIVRVIGLPLSDPASAGQRAQLFIDTLICGFVGGYFSDSAMAKLQEIARTLFGSTGEGDSKKGAPSGSAPTNQLPTNTGNTETVRPEALDGAERSKSVATDSERDSPKS